MHKIIINHLKKKKTFHNKKRDLMWPIVASEFILYMMKSLKLYYGSTHKNLYKIRFTNEFAKTGNLNSCLIPVKAWVETARAGYDR